MKKPITKGASSSTSTKHAKEIKPVEKIQPKPTTSKNLTEGAVTGHLTETKVESESNVETEAETEYENEPKSRPISVASSAPVRDPEPSLAVVEQPTSFPLVELVTPSHPLTSSESPKTSEAFCHPDLMEFTSFRVGPKESQMVGKTPVKVFNEIEAQNTLKKSQSFPLALSLIDTEI
jgi:hypothetical protein